MRFLDWFVLVGSLFSIVAYGLYRSRGSSTMEKYLLGGRAMPWYAMALSIMATQAGAITFISTTGQSYVDGMRFVQFYFGLPIAMVILSATAAPIFHRSGVYTAYEYLEKRFDPKTRALASVIFLIERGVSVGISIYAPAIVLAVIFGWPDRITTLIMGLLVITYTVIGGIRAVTWTDVQQMCIIFLGLVTAMVMIIVLLPPEISMMDAMFVAGKAGKLKAVDLKFDPNSRYNVWSGLIGGAFLALAYFGCDQSQVQRYLTGKSIAQSKLSLLFNATAKIPMQFFILFVGAMVFVFHIFEKPPVLFEANAMRTLEASPRYPDVKGRFDRAFDARRQAAGDLVAARHSGDAGKQATSIDGYRAAQKDLDAVRRDAGAMIGPKFDDTNYIFLSYVTKYLPAGVVGLVIAVIFAAAMSSISGEVNSLATVTVIDIYKRHLVRNGTDAHYVLASRVATAFWGMYAVLFAQFGRSVGSLIETVNRLGSLFYGSLLGVFTLAFFFPKVGGNGAFYGMIAAEIAIFAAYFFTGIAFLWYNVIGCVVVIATGLMFRQRD